MEIEHAQKAVHQTAVDHGWWDDAPNIPEKLMLIVSEVSEALEEYRAGNLELGTYFVGHKPEGFEVELADVVIRVMDLAEYLKINLAAVIAEKNNYNRSREYRHGNKLA